MALMILAIAYFAISGILLIELLLWNFETADFDVKDYLNRHPIRKALTCVLSSIFWGPIILFYLIRKLLHKTLRFK